MHLHDTLLIALAFFSEVLGTVSGFGSSTFFVPSATLFENFKLVLALTALLHCFGNTFKILFFRQSLNWKLIFQFAIPSVIFCAFGALLTSMVSLRWLENILGGFLIVYAIWKFLAQNKDISHLPPWVSTLLNITSGFLTGLIGTGGALRGVALSTLNLSKGSFVFLSSIIDISGDVTRAVIYLFNGYMDWHQWFYIPLLFVAAYFGAKIGKWILQKIDQKQFDKIVLIFIFLNGIMMVLKK